MADRDERILRFHVIGRTKKLKNRATVEIICLWMNLLFNVRWIKFAERSKNKIQRWDSAVNYILYRCYFLPVYTWNPSPNRASSTKTRWFWSVHGYKLLAMPILRYRTMYIVACIVKLNHTSVFVVLSRGNKKMSLAASGPSVDARAASWFKLHRV